MSKTLKDMEKSVLKASEITDVFKKTFGTEEAISTAQNLHTNSQKTEEKTTKNA